MAKHVDTPFDEAILFPWHLGTLNIASQTPQIPSTEYGVFFLEADWYPEMLSHNREKNDVALKRLLSWNFDFEIGKRNQSFYIDTIYPEDSYGVLNDQNKKNGTVRNEELMTFTTVDPETGKVLYMTRTRPDMDGTNTPGDPDPGVFSHGGLPHAGVINAWRYVGDKLWVNDDWLSEAEYLQYLRDNPFPQDIGTIDAWALIVANSSNARNDKKARQWLPLEKRNSGLITVRAITVTYTDFQKILESQNAGNLLPIRYSVVELDSPVGSEEIKTPKHKWVHTLLQQSKGKIQTKVGELSTSVSQRIQDIM